MIALIDDGGNINGGVNNHSVSFFVINVLAVNDAPAFSVPSSVLILENSGRVSVKAVSSISPGAFNEDGQQLSFMVTHLSGNASIFVAPPPVLDRHGNLSLETQPDANGETCWIITLIDDGGNLNGGVNNQSISVFVIDVLAVNDAPTFSVSSTVVIMEEDEDKPSVVQLATNIAPGPWNEVDQRVAFNITPTTVLLSMLANGSLVLKRANLANTVVVWNVSLSDDGGEINGGKSRSRIQQVVAEIVLRAPEVNLSAYQLERKSLPWHGHMNGSEADLLRQ